MLVCAVSAFSSLSVVTSSSNMFLLSVFEFLSSSGAADSSQIVSVSEL